jgi:hypothetical protein
MDRDLYGKMKEVILKNNFKLGLNGGSMDSFPHHIGMPDRTYVAVEPEYSPIDGLCTVLVNPERVEMWVLKSPYNYNEWGIYKSKEYAHKKEMLSILKDYTKEPRGPWK